MYIQKIGANYMANVNVLCTTNKQIHQKNITGKNRPVFLRPC